MRSGGGGPIAILILAAIAGLVAYALLSISCSRRGGIVVRTATGYGCAAAPGGGR